MPALFIFALVVMAFAAIATVATRFFEHQGDRRIARIVGIGLAVLGGVILPFLSCVTIVPANQVGVITNFGSWSGTRQEGLSLTAPWSTLDTFPTRNQKSVRDAGPEGDANCVQVKIKGDSGACVDLTVLYTIDRANAEKLWRGWGSFAKLNSDLINRATDDATNAVFAPYAAEDISANRSTISDQLHAALRARLEPQGVQLDSVTLGITHLPRETQERIDRLLTADANLKVAQKGEEQAKAESRTAQARQGSLTREALVMECLRTAREVRPLVMPDCGLGAGPAAQPLINLPPR